MHACVLVVALTLSGFVSGPRLAGLGGVSWKVLDAQGASTDQGELAGAVSLGRSGTIVKPLVAPTDVGAVHAVSTYTVQPGDTVATIAASFGLTPEQVRWSNPALLTAADRVTPGQRLLLPPLPGVVAVIRPGDSVGSLATAFRVDPERIIDYNYLRDPLAVSPGDVLVVPGGTGGDLWPKLLSSDPPALGRYDNSRFYRGQCTWYVASRRPIPWLGDAGAWLRAATAAGFPTGAVPQPGAIMVSDESWAGHVALVEQVNYDGSFVVSEMNFRGWNVIDTRTIHRGDRVPILGFIY